MGRTSWRICGYGVSYCDISYFSIQVLVITGATDGIGREFAVQLAKAGFSVVLVSRNPEKLQKLANEISEPLVPKCQHINTFGSAANHNVDVKVQALDFSRHDQAHAYEALGQQLQNLEVGVLG